MLYEILHNFFCQKERQELKAIQTLNKQLEKKIYTLNNQIERKNKRIKILISKLKESTIKPYSGKHQEAKITYERPIWTGKKLERIKIDVRNFIQPNNFDIIEDLKRKNLLYTGKQDLDKLIPAIYWQARRKFKYASDSRLDKWGEFWLFPFESLFFINQGKGVDCEDWAILIGSYFASAGIPRERWWITAGDSRHGYGHATIYAKDNNGKWHHLNSTLPAYRYSDLKKYPLNTDKNDILGLKTYWFSFNDYWAISDFGQILVSGKIASRKKRGGKVGKKR